ncbi:carboxy-S-adenosyl-L-methionine synthase CmoA [Helicobacter turcicus]|uniref:Carboxy-S-adenosyl-L-methionine synthase n=1 Tax=Helicobacter turcicus TaxID=2867412 RepID=A0ABS7JKM4_9HELI|nr:carboxy-S-adenosyl-L-methionine synthase CmoA [Helicobacter turcicus]MBX7489939.1 carboxy-S-adenosyl-L-methionine synthase CmoA [Helicobacter turcicus]MBX7544799.1 carboxy-S-adenosyl-L-methionine synthase CmoA [Helicobacter turcicus]
MMDKVFTQTPQKQFEFDANVAGVFDDMLSRSIPYYKEVLGLSADFALEYSKKDSVILDLGTSTGAMLLEIASKAKIPLELYGIDNSRSMLECAQRKLNAYGMQANLICGDILQEEFPKCDVIIANYTLQFIRPLEREKLVQKIFKALNANGIFILSEKVICEDKTLDFKMIQYYLESKKKRGYSEFEISKKREALENVLIPYSEKENKTMLKNAGFSHIQTLFCWVNFATFIAIKE